MDRALLDGGYRCYTGEKIDVYFNTAICQHSGNCVRGNGKLFNLKRKPWIMPDEVDVAKLVKMVFVPTEEILPISNIPMSMKA